MCGISGILNLDGAEAPLAGAVHAMSEQLRHRGPDDEGYLLVRRSGEYRTYSGADTPMGSPLAGVVPGYPEADIRRAQEAPAMLALGHRRLSIVDLSEHGHQPMCSDDGRH
mgnify:CR=1 FL=1